MSEEKSKPETKEIIDPRTVVAYSELLETVVDLVNQHCQVQHDPEYVLDDMAISANENAIEVLERLGIVEQVEGKLRCYRLKWEVLETMVKKFGGQAKEHIEKGLTDEQKKILYNHAVACCGKLPTDFLENDQNLWRAFNAGRMYERGRI